MKTKLTQCICLFLLFLNWNSYSQNFYYKKNGSPISLLTTNKYCFYYFFDKHIYKMNYHKQIIDSVFVPNLDSGCRGKFKGTDTLVVVYNHNLDSISIVLLDTNLNILNQILITKQNNWTFLALNNFLILPKQLILLCDVGFSNGIKTTIIKLSYNGQYVLNFFLQNSNSLFAYNINDCEFYYGILLNQSDYIHVYKLDTLLNLLWQDTIPLIRPYSNIGFINRFNNKFILSTTHNHGFYYYNGIGIYDLNFDTVYAFNYFSLGNPLSEFDALPAFFNVFEIDKKVYCGGFTKAYTNEQKLAITCMDTNLNIKWQKFFLEGFKTWSSGTLYPAPDGGCIFSMFFLNPNNNLIDGVIVWLDSTGNQVLSIPPNITMLNTMRFYPNPGTNEVNIVFPENTKPTTIEIYNDIGILCQKIHFNNHYLHVNTAELISGIYFYRLVQNNNIISQGKWIKE